MEGKVASRQYKVLDVKIRFGDSDVKSPCGDESQIIRQPADFRDPDSRRSSRSVFGFLQVFGTQLYGRESLPECTFLYGRGSQPPEQNLPRSQLRCTIGAFN